MHRYEAVRHVRLIARCFGVAAFLACLALLMRISSAASPALASLAVIATVPALAQLLYMLVAAFSATADDILGAEHKRDHAEAPAVTVIIAARDEDPKRVAQVVKRARMSSAKGTDVILADNGSQDDFARACGNLSHLCDVIRVPSDHLRQFGAQLVAARKARTEWLAIVDADYVVEPGWIDRAMRLLMNEKGDAIGFPQTYENNGSATCRWANSVLAFEFDVENPYRCRANAQTLSGTMVVVRREDFMRYYGALERAPFTADYGFALWLHGQGRHIVVRRQREGIGLAPVGLRELARQQAKWSDDLPQYVASLVTGSLGWSLSRHWHLQFVSVRSSTRGMLEQCE